MFEIIGMVVMTIGIAALVAAIVIEGDRGIFEDGFCEEAGVAF